MGIAIGGRHCGHAMAYDGSLRPGSKARIMIRPQNLHVEAGNIGADQPNQAESMQARLTDIMVTGGMTKLYLQAIEPVNGGTEVIAAFPTNRLGEQYEIGQALRLRWSASDAVAIAE